MSTKFKGKPTLMTGTRISSRTHASRRARSQWSSQLPASAKRRHGTSQNAAPTAPPTRVKAANPTYGTEYVTTLDLAIGAVAPTAGGGAGKVAVAARPSYAAGVCSAPPQVPQKRAVGSASVRPHAEQTRPPGRGNWPVGAVASKLIVPPDRARRTREPPVSSSPGAYGAPARPSRPGATSLCSLVPVFRLSRVGPLTGGRTDAQRSLARHSV